MCDFKEMSIAELQTKPFEIFGKDFMALCVGSVQNGCNAMTIAWGHLGSLWERGSHANRLPTVMCFVRPSRYTKEFMDREPYFTLCTFKSGGKKTLGYLGSHSGRDGDKFKAAGLTPVFKDNTVYCAEAETVFICRKLYAASLQEASFVDKALVEFNYPDRDFHTMYIGEIVKILKKA